jgi:hypothetical protein
LDFFTFGEEFAMEELSAPFFKHCRFLFHDLLFTSLVLALIACASLELHRLGPCDVLLPCVDSPFLRAGARLLVAQVLIVVRRRR